MEREWCGGRQASSIAFVPVGKLDKSNRERYLLHSTSRDKDEILIGRSDKQQNGQGLVLVVRKLAGACALHGGPGLEPQFSAIAHPRRQQVIVQGLGSLSHSWETHIVFCFDCKPWLLLTFQWVSEPLVKRSQCPQTTKIEAKAKFHIYFTYLFLLETVLQRGRETERSSLSNLAATAVAELI